MDVSVHGSTLAISMLHLFISSSTIVSGFNKLHLNARWSARSDVDTAAKIIRWVHLYSIIASFLDKFLLQFLTEKHASASCSGKELYQPMHPWQSNSHGQWWWSISLAPISFVHGITVSQSMFHPYMNLISTMSNLHHGSEALCILRKDSGLCIAIPVDDIEACAAGVNVPSH